jgi:type VI secretion system ImpM family protein
MQASSQSATFFGKIPTHGDFVRHQAGGAGVRALDEWFQRGVYAARQRYGQVFDEVYDAAGTLGFYFQSRNEALVGVMGAGRDRVGRRYPFAVLHEGADQIASSQDLAQIPVRRKGWFDQAHQLVEEALAGHLDHHALPEQEALPQPAGSDGRGFQTYLRETNLFDFWTRLWGHPDDSRKYLVFKNLLDILTPLQGQVPGHFPLALRFPLCPDGQTPAYDAGVWLSLTMRLLHDAECRPSFFWTLTGASADPLLLLVLQPPKADTFAHLFVRDAHFHTLCDLEVIGAQNAALAVLGIPAQYGEWLESETATLWDLLQAFTP